MGLKSSTSSAASCLLCFPAPPPPAGTGQGTADGDLPPAAFMTAVCQEETLLRFWSPRGHAQSSNPQTEAPC